jgi:phosphoenolpyruvate carboxykinase (GTP)
MPRYQDLNWHGLDYPQETYFELMDVERERGLAEAEDQRNLFKKFGAALPQEMEQQRQELISRLERAPKVWSLRD